MSKIGQMVKETIDFSNNTVQTLSFTKACEAFNETAKKNFGKDNISENEYANFYKENWWLINLIGLPGSFPVEDEIVETAKTKIFMMGTIYKIEDIILYLVKKNLKTRGLPMGFEFHNLSIFELEENKVMIPKQLIYGILGAVVFNPINKDEEIEENYWIGFGGYKMFVSELWGRMDLAERAMKYG